MDLFDCLQLTITLPEKRVLELKSGQNSVVRLLIRSRLCDVEVKESAFDGYFELATELPPPLNVMYLKNSRSKGRCPTGVPVLKGKQAFDIAELSPETDLVWAEFPDELDGISPREIVRSWGGQFLFKEEGSEQSVLGLRRPQLGALHAISAYFATDREVDPATVVLPTGTGKTETMLATMIYQKCDKVLVIVPSDSLRTQISGKFLNLGYLPELGIVPVGINLPAVAIIKSGIRTTEAADNLANTANVIVATTSVLSASEPEAVDRLCERCSHLFVDEAHHISAKSWLEVLERFRGKKVLQFTATPFRNDKKALGGRVIFNYTMGEAQRAGYFTHVDLLPVEEYYEDRTDTEIAAVAVERLREDLAHGFDHLMMVRTSSKSKAEALLSVYEGIAADLKPVVVHSTYGKPEIRRRLEGLLAGRSKIVICVDMLGEGYDLPNLKVAALHDHHKSLAVTLQFIGRFTRVSHKERLGKASVVMNVADPDVEGDLQNLYSQGADWDSVLRRLSENRIEREVRLQEVVDSLKQQGDLHKQISLWNLEPSYTATLFRTSCENWEPERFVEKLPKFDEYWHAISSDENLLVVLAIQSAPVKWGSYKDLRDTNFKLLIAHWDKERNALFVFSNDYKTFRVEALAEAIALGQCELISGDQVFNVFNGIEYPLARNLGTAQEGAISFTQYFGPNVTEGLSLIESERSSLSNIAALGYESGNRVVWGCSQRKGKVWSPQKRGSIADWCAWAKKAWDKVISAQPAEHNFTKNFLRPERMRAPHKSYPLSVQLGEQLLTAFEDKVDVFFGEVSVPLFAVDVETDGREQDGSVRISISCDAETSIYKLVIDDEATTKGYDYELVDGPEVAIQRGDSDAVSLPEYMVSDPFTIHYADSAFSYNAQIVHVRERVGLYRKDDIVPFDWQGTDIRVESMGYGRNDRSIQWRYFMHICNEYDLIINDDGSGEAADLVALKMLDDGILLTLVHLKYSNDDEPGARLKDLYEVCGQAQRSVRWKHLNLNYLYHHIRRREEQWRPRGYSRFLKGGIKDLAAFRDRSRTTPLKFHIEIVQPGLSIKKVNEEGLKLLGSTALYIKKTTMAELSVIGSQ
ncbi:DEAD/DEAH box helicase [Marinobacter nauticus]|uniref:DEAD/DEAH box helicase n=1 Tax=Marinobacter nauticus TaxID=2743 RepID=UPI001C961FF2|nr:DEAD/DEAH box helicase family protein [Marinobacter nauticus]MBY6102424.1 DEAD/DEAH box helicase family protein [Marinobacter nauticus]